jgi:hypothetical protein
MRRLATIGIGLALASSCKPKCADPGDDPAGIDAPTLERMKTEASKNPSFCSELQPARVSLTGADLTLTGPAGVRNLAKREDLPSAETKRVTALYDRLKKYRELWKQLRPEKDFPGNVDLSFDPSLESDRAFSVLYTAAFAGYPNVRLTTGSITLDFAAFVPTPKQEGRTLVIAPEDAASFVMRLRDSATCEDVAEKTLAKNDTLGPLVAQVCTGKTPCADVILIHTRANARIVDIAPILRDVLAGYPSAPQPPRIGLRTGPVRPCTKADSSFD